MAILLVALLAVAVSVNLRFSARATVRARIHQGIQAYESGKVDVAMDAWREAIRLDPDSTEAMGLLSEALLSHGDPADALPLLNRMRSVSANLPHLYCRRSEALTRSGDARAGEAAAKEAVDKEPDCARAHALYGIAMSDREDHAVAVSELTRAAILAPQDNRIGLSLAQAQLNAADLQGAEKSVRAVLSREPDNLLGLFLLGWSYARRSPTPDNIGQATAAFEKVVAKDPKKVEAIVELGRLQSLAGQHARAVTTLERAEALGAATPDIAFNLATAHRALGHRAQADRYQARFKVLSDRNNRMEALRKRLAVDGNDFVSAIELAGLYADSRNWADAEPLVKRLIEVRPTDRAVNQIALRVFTALGDEKMLKQMRSMAGN